MAEHWERNKRIGEIKDRIERSLRFDPKMPVELSSEEILTILDVLDYLTERDER